MRGFERLSPHLVRSLRRNTERTLSQCCPADSGRAVSPVLSFVRIVSFVVSQPLSGAESKGSDAMAA